MPQLSYQTAGESHGPALVVTVTGLPQGLEIDEAFINAELERRQGGYGRGGRQNIETDTIEILTGVRAGHSIGSPLTMKIVNRDSRMDDLAKTPPISRPRPGHADLAGSIKYLTSDCRETLERASARETASRVAAGALSRVLLKHFGIEAFGFVRSIGAAACTTEVTEANYKEVRTKRDASDTYCPDVQVSEQQRAIIRQAKIDKDTIGGLVEAHIFGCPPGLGSCMDDRDKLDARIACAVMGIQAIKSVEIGLGKDVATRPGSQVHDPIRFDESQQTTHTLGYSRDSNNAGGTEGGMTNGQPVVVRAAMKPISTLLRGMPSIDLITKAAEQSAYERSDVCAVSACSVVVENVVAFEIARVLSEKCGGDSLGEMLQNYKNYLRLASILPRIEPTGRFLA